MFLRCSARRALAENTGVSLHRSTRVWVHGRLTQHTVQTCGGDKRVAVELDVDEIGPFLRFATATIHRHPRPSGGTGPGEDQTPAT